MHQIPKYPLKLLVLLFMTMRRRHQELRTPIHPPLLETTPSNTRHFYELVTGLSLSNEWANPTHQLNVCNLRIDAWILLEIFLCQARGLCWILGIMIMIEQFWTLKLHYPRWRDRKATICEDNIDSNQFCRFWLLCHLHIEN